MDRSLPLKVFGTLVKIENIQVVSTSAETGLAITEWLSPSLHLPAQS